MDEATLRMRLWDGFARLQTLLGGHAAGGVVLERDGLVASVVPSAADSPTLNAAVAVDPRVASGHLPELTERYRVAKVRRWGMWLDGEATVAAEALAGAGMVRTASSPGMGLGSLPEDAAGNGRPRSADLATVGRINDLAYGNYDARLERTLTPLPNGILNAYRIDLDGGPAAVALALHHGDDCGVSFVATVPKARRRGLATRLMRQALAAARGAGCTSSTLQATELGERLYEHLGYRRLCLMQLWERRHRADH